MLKMNLRGGMVGRGMSYVRADDVSKDRAVGEDGNGERSVPSSLLLTEWVSVKGDRCRC